MKSNNNKDTYSEKIITEQTGLTIEQFLDRMIGSSETFIPLRRNIKTECDKILPHYVEVILSYQKACKEQNYTDIIKDFILKCQVFADKMQEVILYEGNKDIDEMIYMTWNAILKKLLTELPKNIDNYFALQLIEELMIVYDKMIEKKGIKPYKRGGN